MSRPAPAPPLEPLVQFRPFREPDLPAVCAIERVTFPEPWTRDQFAGLLAHPAGLGWVADSGEGAIGYAIGWVAGDEAELADLAVARPERRRGIGAGLVRAFAVGYALIGRLPEIVATRLAALFSSPEIRERIGTKPWVLSEVDALVTSGALRHAVLTRRFDDAKETVALLQIALDPHACTVLRALVDDYPAFPLAIEQPAGGEKVTAATRFIDSPDDLATIEKVLQSLEQSVRL